jgi:hypothetical protein
MNHNQWGDVHNRILQHFHVYVRALPLFRHADQEEEQKKNKLLSWSSCGGMPMTDQDFVRNIEKFIHPSIILFTATLCIAGLVTKSINSTVLGNICTFSAIPAGCRQRPDIFGECDPDIARSTAILVYISVIGLEVSCLLGTIGCMTTICCHILKTVKIERALPLPVLPAPPATLVVGNVHDFLVHVSRSDPSQN